jgi:hypothetical protein
MQEKKTKIPRTTYLDETELVFFVLVFGYRLPKDILT